MTATSARTGRDGLVRRIAYHVLARVVRGGHGRGGVWGEAVLAEFHQTKGLWETTQWMIGGLRVAWSEHRARTRQLPRRERIGRRAAMAAFVGCLALPVVSQFALSAVYVPGSSMQPTMHVGDRYLVDKVGFRAAGVHRGDIVTFVSHSSLGAVPAGRTIVKRVVGMPGDTISCREGAVLRNGAVIARPPQADGSSAVATCEETTVPKGYVYVLGDALGISVDSRQSGPIAQKDITGRIAMRIWPLSR